MPHRSSKALLVGFALLALVVIGIVAWRQKPPARSTAAAIEAPRGDEPVPSPSSAELAATADDTPRVTAKPEQRALVSTPVERELAEAIWVTGRVIFPEGTPLDEEVEVIAKGKKFENAEDHRARVAADGSFRVAFSKDSTTGSLEIDAAHLYLAKAVRVKLPPKEPTTLEPAVGARIVGRIVPPLGVDDPGDMVKDKLVTLTGWSRTIESSVARNGKIRADLSFELRGIPPHLDCWVQCDPVVWPARSRSDLKFEPGLDLELELKFDLGVSVSGTVRDEQGVALAKTNVLLYPQNEDEPWMGGQKTTTSKDDGTFAVSGVGAGDLRVHAQRPGFLPEVVEVGRVEHGESRANIELVLRSGHFVAGKVTWPDGTPAVEAQIAIEQPPNEDQDMSFAFGFGNGPTHKSGADGTFRVTGLGPGPYQLTATARPAGEVAPDAGDSGPESEETADPSKSQAKRARWHAELDNVAADTADLQLVLAGGYSVSGVVTDDLGQPIEKFSVFARGADGESPWDINPASVTSGRFRNEQGSFVLEGLLEGKSKVRASALGFADGDEIEVVFPGPAIPLRLVLPRAAALSGRVLDPDGKPLHKASIEVERVGEPSSRFGSSGAVTATSDSKGVFKIKRAPVGRVKVKAVMPAFTASPGLEFDLAPGSTLENVELRLSRGGRLTGEIRSSSTTGGSWSISVHCGQNGEWESTESDAQGRFTIEPLVPGKYELSANAAALPEVNDSGRFSAVRARAQLSQTIEIIDGQTTHVVLGNAAEDFVTVSGTVRSGTRPVERAEVQANHFSATGDHFSSSAVTDANGRYTLELPPKEFSLHVTAGGASVSRRVQVQAGTPRIEDFELGTSKVRGRVTARDGEALNGVQVSAALDVSERALRSEGVYGSASTGRDGTFEIDNLGAGTYTITADGDSVYRRSGKYVAFGSVTRRGIVVSAGTTVEGIEIVLDKAGTLAGRVLDAAGQPVAGVFVRLSDESGALVENTYLHTDESGAYESEGLAPGRYTAQAISNGMISEHSDWVRIESDVRTNLDLVVRPSGNVRVFVEDAQGVLVGASIVVADARGRTASSHQVSSAPNQPDQGQTLGPLVPGTYQVTATNHDRVSASATVEVTAGATSDVRLRLGGQ